MVSILVPCHNEVCVIEGTITHLLDLDYPNYEVVVVDDGSTDGTPKLLRRLMEKLPFRTVFLEAERGQTHRPQHRPSGLPAQFIMTVDADAILDKQALHWIVYTLRDSPGSGR